MSLTPHTDRKRQGVETQHYCRPIPRSREAVHPKWAPRAHLDLALQPARSVGLAVFVFLLMSTCGQATVTRVPQLRQSGILSARKRHDHILPNPQQHSFKKGVNPQHIVLQLWNHDMPLSIPLIMDSCQTALRYDTVL